MHRTGLILAEERGICCRRINCGRVIAQSALSAIDFDYHTEGLLEATLKALDRRRLQDPAIPSAVVCEVQSDSVMILRNLRHHAPSNRCAESLQCGGGLGGRRKGAAGRTALVVMEERHPEAPVRLLHILQHTKHTLSVTN